MIENRTVSVVITTYHPARRAGLDTILRKWLANPVEEVWVLDGSGQFKSTVSDPRLLVFNMPKDLGPGMDYAMAALTQGDLVVLADDDVLPGPGLVAEMADGWAKTGRGLVGLIGRTFHGPLYKGDTKFYAARNVDEPVRVGFVGVVILAERSYLGFDVRGLTRNADDLFWQMQVFPKVGKWVAPAKDYLNTPEASDNCSAMYRTLALKEERQAYYEKWWRQNYEPTGATV